MEHYRQEAITAVVINKKVDCIATVLHPLNQIEKGELNYLIVNMIPFERKDFECKNGRFNRSKAIRLLADAYMIDVLREIANRDINA